MADLKSLRKRIGSVKNTQKLTRAMKMVAGARLNRAQHRITAMRPYAIRTASVLSEVVGSGDAEQSTDELAHPLLARRSVASRSCPRQPRIDERRRRAA